MRDGTQHVRDDTKRLQLAGCTRHLPGDGVHYHRGLLGPLATSNAGHTPPDVYSHTTLESELADVTCFESKLTDVIHFSHLCYSQA